MSVLGGKSNNIAIKDPSLKKNLLVYGYFHSFHLHYFKGKKIKVKKRKDKKIPRLWVLGVFVSNLFVYLTHRYFTEKLEMLLAISTK